jgi:hypothetical protein
MKRMNERVAYFSILAGRSLCESKQTGQIYRRFLLFLTLKRQRERGEKFLLSLLATYKHTTGNSVHCIGQAIAAVYSIFPSLILSQYTKTREKERKGE